MPVGDGGERTVSEIEIPPNMLAILEAAESALAANATFLAIGAPTNAQVLAQVQTLTKECNGIIRLLTARLESTSGTS
jgi:hypothetical protein